MYFCNLAHRATYTAANVQAEFALLEACDAGDVIGMRERERYTELDGQVRLVAGNVCGKRIAFKVAAKVERLDRAK